MRRLIGPDAARVVLLEQAFQAFVPKRLPSVTVPCSGTLGNKNVFLKKNTLFVSPSKWTARLVVRRRSSRTAGVENIPVTQDLELEAFTTAVDLRAYAAMDQTGIMMFT